MEANGQTLYNDDLLNILPDGVIILDINREVIQLNQQAFTELHVHSSVNAMMPLPTNKIFKLLNKKEDILSTILEEIRQGKKVYSLPEHTFMQEQVDYTQFPIRGEFATMENEEGEKNILFFFRNITVELTQEYILNTALQRTRCVLLENQPHQAANQGTNTSGRDQPPSGYRSEGDGTGDQ